MIPEPRETQTVVWCTLLLRRAVDVKPAETRPMLLACAYFFFLLTSYFILRPVRDAMGVAAGVFGLPWLFAGTLSAMLLCSPLFSALVVRFPVKRCIAITYHFFAFNLVLFYLLTRVLTGGAEAWLGRVFFVWTSVFNLYIVSIFWALMADSFRSEQAKRLFGFIGVGGTVGSIVGSAITALLARQLGTAPLLLISAALLEVTARIAAAFPSGGGRPQDVFADANASAPIGGSLWAGISHLSRSPYLMGIAGFIVLYTFGSTVLYFEQSDVIGRFYASREARTEVRARMEFGAQVLAALTQTFFTGRIVRRLGLAATLALMPAISIIGFSAIGASAFGVTPLLATFITFSVLRRASNFALTNPAMEVLFTVVSREEKFKAKSFIETFVYRAGDQVAAWGYAGLAALGLSLTGIAWTAAPLSVLFLLLGWWLGGREADMAARRRGRPPAPERLPPQT